MALLLTGVPSVALAETDVVLYNESQDSNVQTGESSFNNSTANESTAATFDPPVEGQSVTSIQSTSTAPRSEQVRSAAPKVMTPVQTQVAAATSKTVDALFVGMSVGSTVGP